MKRKEFTINVESPEHDGQVLMLGLSRLIGAPTLQRDWNGREFIALPAPFSDVRIFDQETLTPTKAARLAAAIRHFEQQTGAIVDREALSVLRAGSVTRAE